MLFHCSKNLDSDHVFNCIKKPAAKYVIKRHNDVLKKLALHAEKSGFDVKIEPRLPRVSFLIKQI
jgi:hypothetical protein